MSKKNCLCVTVLCTIIMVHKDTSSSYRLVNCIAFDLAWFSSVFGAPLCLWSSWCYILSLFCLHPSLYLLVS